MDADDRIHKIAIQKHLGQLDPGRPLCPRCGRETMSFDSHRDDDFLPQLCGWCLLDRLAGLRKLDLPPVTYPKRTSCNRCAKEKPLIGAWCYSCRDQSRWALITEYATESPRHPDHLRFLSEYAAGWSVWSDHRAELQAWGLWTDPKAIAKAS